MSAEQRETDDQRAERLAAQADEGRRIHDEDAYRRASRRAFITGGVASAVGLGAWVTMQTGPTDRGIPSLLRGGFAFNEAVWQPFDRVRSAPEHDPEDAQDLRVNGTVGIKEEIDLDAWTMVVQDDAGDVVDELDLGPVRELEEVDMVTLHKCIEGWSEMAWWTGVRLSDFMARYPDEVTGTDFVSFQTPDAGYYVGIERHRALHPQTLLAYGLNGEPLTQDHGAPLRLYTPNNYGIKSLKRIGVIQFTNTKPADFWAERGYDWYSTF